jgi:hypothetical protein
MALTRNLWRKTCGFIKRSVFGASFLLVKHLAIKERLNANQRYTRLFILPHDRRNDEDNSCSQCNQTTSDGNRTLHMGVGESFARHNWHRVGKNIFQAVAGLLISLPGWNKTAPRLL